MAGPVGKERVGNSTKVGAQCQELLNDILSFGDWSCEGYHFPQGSSKCTRYLVVSEWTPRCGCLTHACCFQVDSSQLHNHLDSHVTLAPVSCQATLDQEMNDALSFCV